MQKYINHLKTKNIQTKNPINKEKCRVESVESKENHPEAKSLHPIPKPYTIFSIKNYHYETEK